MNFDPQGPIENDSAFMDRVATAFETMVQSARKVDRAPREVEVLAAAFSVMSGRILDLTARVERLEGGEWKDS